MQRVTINNSKKIYVFKYALNFLGVCLFAYCSMVLLGLDPSETVFTSIFVAVGAIISSLNIADGMKGHEPSDGSD